MVVQRKVNLLGSGERDIWNWEEGTMLTPTKKMGECRVYLKLKILLVEMEGVYKLIF